MTAIYVPKKSECPMLHGAIEAYGLTDKQVENWCEKGCCPDCGHMLEKNSRKKVKTL